MKSHTVYFGMVIGPNNYVFKLMESADKPAEVTFLDPRLDIANHSPTGFAWGYLGSGPSQLALAILADYFDDDRALRMYKSFKHRLISRLPMAGCWRIHGNELARITAALAALNLKSQEDL